MVAMTGVSDWSTKIPGAFFYVPAPSWISIAIYYTALIVGLSGWLNSARRKIVFAAVLSFIAAIYFWRWEISRGETEVTVLPLNGGHAVWVDAAGRKNDWLVDCGNTNAVNLTLKQYLRAQGVNRIPRLILTGGGAKNCGGAQLLDDLFGVSELWTSNARFRSTVYREVVEGFEKSARHKTLNCGEKVGCWEVLWPAATNQVPRADDNALVLFGDLSGAKILLLSDLGRAGQSSLLAQTNDLLADIVVAGLPDGSEPLSDALIDVIQPKVIVIADSEYPATRRAGHELKERLATRNVPVIYTRAAGAVTISFSKAGWQMRTMDGQRFSSAAPPK
jgi:beta-lactamase superfamily II metal-dependent hydrolase